VYLPHSRAAQLVGWHQQLSRVHSCVAAFRADALFSSVLFAFSLDDSSALPLDPLALKVWPATRVAGPETGTDPFAGSEARRGSIFSATLFYPPRNMVSTHSGRRGTLSLRLPGRYAGSDPAARGQLVEPGRPAPRRGAPGTTGIRPRGRTSCRWAGRSLGASPASRSSCTAARRAACFALDDRCAHRQVPLHLGVVAGGQIKCDYHGWPYECSGRCVNVPNFPV
jgi:Rieske [2Fe-2S] domain